MPRFSTRLASLLTAALLALPAGDASADENDFVLHRFLTCEPPDAPNCSGGIQRQDPTSRDDGGPAKVFPLHGDARAFGSFAKELGVVFAPRSLGPAETLGLAGFSFGVGTSMTTINNGKPYWIAASPKRDSKPDSALTTLHLQLRKGLPFSFEIGAGLTHLLQSEMYALGAELKWSLNEGFLFLPDFAMRASVNRMVGNRDLDLLVAGGELSASHPFPIKGMVTLTPYAGWSRLLINASSHVLDGTPGLNGFPPPHCATTGPNRGGTKPLIEGDNSDIRYPPACARALESAETDDRKANFVLGQQRHHLNRFFGGLRAKFTVVSFVAEAATANEQWAWSGKLEFDF